MERDRSLLEAGPWEVVFRGQLGGRPASKRRRRNCFVGGSIAAHPLVGLIRCTRDNLHRHFGVLDVVGHHDDKWCIPLHTTAWWDACLTQRLASNGGPSFACACLAAWLGRALLLAALLGVAWRYSVACSRLQRGGGSAVSAARLVRTKFRAEAEARWWWRWAHGTNRPLVLESCGATGVVAVRGLATGGARRAVAYF